MDVRLASRSAFQSSRTSCHRPDLAVGTDRQPIEIHFRTLDLHPEMPIAVLSGSCGKDSVLALYYARQNGFDVRFQICMLEESGRTSRSHGIPLKLVQMQADAQGLELIAPAASWKTYEEQFVGALKECAAKGATVAIFGDIDLQDHKDWEEKVCAKAGLEAHLPLWLRKRDELAKEVLEKGFKAEICTIDSRYLGDEFCGKDYDEAFLKSLPEKVDLCGENGEFHTFVWDGPGFKSPVNVTITEFAEYTAPPEYGSVRYLFAKLAAKKD